MKREIEYPPGLNLLEEMSLKRITLNQGAMIDQCGMGLLTASIHHELAMKMLNLLLLDLVATDPLIE